MQNLMNLIDAQYTDVEMEKEDYNHANELGSNVAQKSIYKNVLKMITYDSIIRI